MKQDIIYKILRKIKEKPSRMRKVKIFVAVGFVGLLVTGALVIWAGVSALNYVASKTNEVIQSPTAQAKVENFKLKADGLKKFQPCWVKAQSLMTIEPWLLPPALENLINLKVACLEAKLTECEGHDCKQMKNQMNAAERGTI
ncbi:MAG: hypothetical protein H7328_07905 [Bdellovibrio sp.]|nr:hypothetical protein [Bdellovibrio sp.]